MFLLKFLVDIKGLRAADAEMICLEMSLENMMVFVFMDDLFNNV